MSIIDRLFLWRLLALLAVLPLASAPPAAASAGTCPVLGAPSSPARPPAPPGYAVEPPLDTSDACAAWRWVAIQRDPSTPCPDPGEAAGASWMVSPLFTSEPGDLPAALGPYCVYTHDQREPAVRSALEERLARLVRRGDLRQIDASCAALAPMAESTGNVAPNFEAHFLAHAEAFPKSRDRPVAASPSVRLAVVDTQPDGKTDAQGKSAHGFSLARMAERLVCRDGDRSACAARVVPRLALPISRFDWSDPRDVCNVNNPPSGSCLDWAGGGFFGTIDQLADAVWREVDAWRGSDAEHLVLNLAVAWVGERFGGMERRVRDMPVPVRALYQALEWASCEGALVVAAAGNRAGGPEIENGPLLPAAWERRAAPDAVACEVLRHGTRAKRQRGHRHHHGHHPSPDDRDRPPPAPLVYAAGGIHGDGAPLVNARPASEPARVAYSDHAWVASDSQLDPASILTGSSVATTVVAAAAAVVWHHQPDWTPARVMAAVEQGGTPLGRQADFQFGEGSPSVRKVAVCPALAEACRSGGGRCGDLGAFTCATPAVPPMGDYDLPAGAVALNLDAVMAGSAFCQVDEVHYNQGRDTPPQPCPFRQRYGIHARPWTGPQPNGNPCSGCAIRPPPPDGDGGWVLHIEIDPEWPKPDLEETFLVMDKTRIDLGLPPLTAGSEEWVRDLDAAYFAADADGRRPKAVLQFTTKNGVIESPVYIAE